MAAAPDPYSPAPAWIGPPLSKAEAIARLKALEPEIREMGIVSLYLFGSTVRDEAGPDSDIDLYGDLEPGRTFGWDFFSLGRRIGDHLGRPVDFIERTALHPLLKSDIEASAQPVF